MSSLNLTDLPSTKTRIPLKLLLSDEAGSTRVVQYRRMYEALPRARMREKQQRKQAPHDRIWRMQSACAFQLFFFIDKTFTWASVLRLGAHSSFFFIDKTFTWASVLRLGAHSSRCRTHARTHVVLSRIDRRASQTKAPRIATAAPDARREHLHCQMPDSELCVLCSRFVTSMSNLKQVFDKAAEHVKTLSSVSQDDQKYLYGRFKQAKVGDCNTGKPGILNPKERAKWEAWNSLKGMSADDAMRQYIAKVDSLAGSSFGSEVQ